MAVWTSWKRDGFHVHMAATGSGLSAISLSRPKGGFLALLRSSFPECSWRLADDDALLAEARQQIEDYLAGSRQDFSLPLDLRGTPYQRLIWREVSSIPYGQTRSYQKVAEMTGRPRAMRAVGNAMGENRLGLVIPCHRVIASGGRLGGYGGNTGLKIRLLKLEGAWDHELSKPIPAK